MKKMILFSVLPALLALSGTSPIFADHGSGSCSRKHFSRSHEEKENTCPITSKLMKKAHFYLEHQKDLGLTEDQVAVIKDLKLETKKTSIRQSAEMQIFSLDVQHKMAQTEVDVDGISAMIDQMSAAMTASAKEILNSFVKLKAVLTPEQTARAKELWLDSMKG